MTCHKLLLSAVFVALFFLATPHAVDAYFVQVYVCPEGIKNPFWDNLSKELVSYYGSVAGKDYSVAESKANNLLKTASKANDKGLALAFCKSNVAKLYQDIKHYEKAKSLLLEAAPVLEEQASKKDPMIAVTFERLAEISLLLRAFDTAEGFNKKALAACANIKDDHHTLLLRFMDQQGVILLAQGKFPQAIEQFNKAIKIAEQDPVQKAMLAILLDNCAETHGVAGDIDEAYQLNKRAFQLAEEGKGMFDATHLPLYLTHIAARSIQLKQWSDASGYIDRALETINERHIKDGERVSKLKSMKELVESKIKAEGKTVGGGVSSDKPARKEAASVSNAAVLEDLRQANVLMAAYRWAEAEPLLRRAVEAGEKTLPPDSQLLAKTYLDMGIVLNHTYKAPQAVPFYEKSLAIVKKAQPRNNSAIVSVENAFADCYIQMRRFSDAEPLLKDALAIQDQVESGTKSELLLADMLYNLSVVYREQGKFADAMSLGNRSLKIQERIPQKDKLGIAHCLDNLASLYQQQNLFQDAAPLYKRSLEILEAQFGPDNIQIASALNNLAHNCLREKKLQEAEPLLKRAVSIEEKNNRFAGVAMINLGAVQNAANNFSAAEETLTNAVALYEKSNRSQDTDFAKALAHLATTYYREKKYNEAKSTCQKSLGVFEKTGTLSQMPAPEMQWLLKELQKNGY